MSSSAPSHGTRTYILLILAILLFACSNSNSSNEEHDAGQTDTAFNADTPTHEDESSLPDTPETDTPPPDEVCDGIDNDYDDLIDEGVRNACQGCAELPQTIGEACGECGMGVWGCDTMNEVRCLDEFNACGGCAELDGAPGGECGTCGSGRWVCDGSEAVVCEGDLELAGYDACGGCSGLEYEPGDECGRCGVYSCVKDLLICHRSDERCGPPIILTPDDAYASVHVTNNRHPSPLLHESESPDYWYGPPNARSADLNNDGQSDLVFDHFTAALTGPIKEGFEYVIPDSVDMLFDFSTSWKRSYQVSDGPSRWWMYSSAILDVDGDGNTDLLIAYRGKIRALLGPFKPGYNCSTEREPYYLAECAHEATEVTWSWPATQGTRFNPEVHPLTVDYNSDGADDIILIDSDGQTPHYNFIPGPIDPNTKDFPRPDFVLRSKPGQPAHELGFVGRLVDTPEGAFTVATTSQEGPCHWNLHAKNITLSETQDSDNIYLTDTTQTCFNNVTELSLFNSTTVREQLNKNGYDEIFVSTYQWSQDAIAHSHRILLSIQHSLNTVQNKTNLSRFYGGTILSFFGRSILNSSIGDINGDNVNDLIISGTATISYPPTAGVYIFLGPIHKGNVHIHMADYIINYNRTGLHTPEVAFSGDLTGNSINDLVTIIPASEKSIIFIHNLTNHTKE